MIYNIILKSFRKTSVSKYSPLKLFLRYVALFVVCTVWNCNAQDEFIEVTNKIESYLISYNPQYSLELLNTELKKPQTEEELIILKSLKVEALVQATLFDESMKLSNTMINSPHLKGKYKVRVLLQRALVYEIINKFSESKAELDAVGKLYENPNTRTSKHYGEYLYRLSSLYRVQGERLLALSYAKKSKMFGDKYNFPDVSAVASMLLSFLTDDYSKKFQYANQALSRWKISGDYNGVIGMYNNLAQIHITNKEYSLAIKFCDSALSNTNKIFNNPRIAARANKLKSEALEGLKLQDSALYYFKIYNKLSEDYDIIRQKITVSQHQFDFELEKEKIKRDEAFDDAEKTKVFNNRLILLITILAIFLAMVVFLLYIFNKNNSKIRQQKEIILSANHDLSASVNEKELLYKELHHRVKNNLALILSLIEFQSEELEDPLFVEKFENLKNRIASIAMLHNQFLNNKDSVLTEQHHIRQYIDKIANSLISLSSRAIIFSCQADDIVLPVDKALPIGMLINELIANTIKHANTGGQTVIVNLQITQKAGKVIVDYKDNGTSFLATDETNSLGTFIIESMILQLSGEYTRTQSHYVIVLNIN